jgi:DNA-binding NarL/FixJ family response regulator
VRLVRILIADRRRSFAEMLAVRLSAEADFRVVGTEASGAAAARSVDVLGPDVLIVDMTLEDVSLVELTAELTSRQPPIQVVCVFDPDDTAATADVLRSGAAAVVTRDTPIGDLVQALVAVVNNGAWVPSHLLRGVLRELSPVPPLNEYGERIQRLTQREREVLDRMVAGEDRAAIARTLYLSVNTVRTHTKNILAKLEAHSSLEAVSVALKARERAGV